MSIRLAFRSIVRAPAFSAMVIVVLALGVGLSTAVFTVADGLILRRLPVHDQDRIVRLSGTLPDGSLSNVPVTVAQAGEFARSARALDSLAYVAYEGAWPVTVRIGDSQLRLRRALTSGNYFDVLGSQPVKGRLLEPDDNTIGAAPVAVISHDTWLGQFGGDPDVLGTQFTVFELNLTYTVVGVAAPGLDYPARTDFWAPYVPARLTSEADASAYPSVTMVARLAESGTVETAVAELDNYFATTSSPLISRDMKGVAERLSEAILGDTRSAVVAFALAAGLLLLITCMNAANLLLVRGMARSREIAVRLALGAPRARIVSQLLLENVVLAAIGGAGGVVGAVAAVRAFTAFAPAALPLVERVQINAAALAIAVATTCLAAVLSGLVPAIVASRPRVTASLRAGARETGSRGLRLAREGLVAGQIALAVVVLCAAALLGRSFAKLWGAELSFDRSQVLVAELAVQAERYPTPQEQVPALRRITAALGATPGIVAASPVVAVPYSGSGGWDGRAAVPGQSAEEAAANPVFNMEVVAPSYFRVIDVPLVSGRLLDERDVEGAERVVVVSASVAERYWRGADPLGQRLVMGGQLERMLTVVGVVEDTRYRDLRVARPTVYFPVAQSAFRFAPTTLIMRTAMSPSTVVPAVRRVVEEAAPGVTVTAAMPFDEHLARPLAQPRLNALLLSVFAMAAALLAAVGVFGVTWTSVRQRLPEIGIRMALGATGSRIGRQVVGRALVVATVGVSIGVLAATATTRFLATLLYDIAPGDAPALIGAGALLVAMSLLASVVPARTASRVAPTAVLRSE